MIVFAIVSIISSRDRDSSTAFGIKVSSGYLKLKHLFKRTLSRNKRNAKRKISTITMLEDWIDSDRAMLIVRILSLEV